MCCCLFPKEKKKFSNSWKCCFVWGFCSFLTCTRLASIVKITAKIFYPLTANTSTVWGLGSSVRLRLQHPELVLCSRRPSTPSHYLNSDLPKWGWFPKAFWKEETKCVFPTSFLGQVVTYGSLGHSPGNWLWNGRAREGRRGRERAWGGERVCYLHVKLASLAGKGNGKNFNGILFLLTGTVSWIFNLPLLWALGKCLYPRAWDLNSVLRCQCLAVGTFGR